MAIGPGAGVGAATREVVMATLRGDRAVVIDADGLVGFAEARGEHLFAASAANGKAVLTPHAGEFHRLFDGALAPGDGSKTDLSKADLARAAARRSGAVVVFKGADTVIAAPDGRAAINANAPPWLATAGTGDNPGQAGEAGLLARACRPSSPPACSSSVGAWRGRHRGRSRHDLGGSRAAHSGNLRSFDRGAARQPRQVRSSGNYFMVARSSSDAP